MKRGHVVIAAGAAGLVALSGCSSSPSPSAKASASASAAASAFEKKFGINPTPDLPPGAHGPVGDITAPASQSPNPTSPGGSVVFPNVSKQIDQQIYRHILKLPGVRSTAYYPQFEQFQVYYRANATAAQRERVYRYVVSRDPAAAGSPSASPSASPSPTASAS